MKTRNHHNKKTLKSGVFIVIAALITAIAVAVTCAMFGFSAKGADDVFNVDDTNVSASTAHTANTAGNHDFTPAGKLSNGDTISLAYCNGQQNIILPQGRYKLEVWGAQGGGPSATVYGGYGGYTYGEIQFTAVTTLYVNIGGAGGYKANATTEAYNGGGAITNGHPAGGGGGASHMATASGKLASLGAGNNNILIVAGGGGGTGCNCATSSTQYAGAGGGGNNSGTDSPYNKHSTNRGGGYGGTLTEGGNGGASSNSTSQKGSFGKGGDQISTQANTGGGGGGGGYYGGGSGGADGANDNDDGWGGGGSGYINTSRMISGTHGGTTGSWGAATATPYSGKAVITAINVNQPPANAGANKAPVTITGRARGTSGNTTITPDNIAVDPDATKTTLHFTDGTASNLVTFNTNPNTGLFLNSACSTLATKYIDWTWGDNRTLKITNYKKYPRNGVDGCTANGVLTLYARVRDTFGTSTQHGWAVIQFKVTVPATVVSRKEETISTSAGSYKLGLSTTTTLDASGNAPTSGIYHPTATGRYTAFIDKSLRIGEPFTISASSLLSGLYSGDMTVISLNSTADVASSNTNRKYKINELDGDSGFTGHGVTAYTTTKTAIANAFDQISITSISPEPGYKVFPVTLHVVEKSAAYTDTTTNVAPDITPITIDIVFRMENSRPYINNYHNVVDLAVGETQTLSLATFFSDADGAITAATHTIKQVIVPEYEFIQLDRHAIVVATTGGNAGYYNVGATDGQVYPTTSPTFTSTAQGDEPTNFRQGIVYNATAGGTDASSTAFMRFTYANDQLTVIGLRSSFSQYSSTRAANAPGHFYLLLNIQDKCEIEDEGIWLPIAFRIGKDDSYDPVATITSPGDLTGQAAVSAYPLADGGRGDSFYFAPMAINASGSHVIGEYKSADDDGNNTGELTSAGLIPLALDGDNFATEDGLADWGAKLNEFLRIADGENVLRGIVESVSEDGVTVVTDDDGAVLYVQNYYIRAEFVNIYILQSMFATSAYGGGRVVVGGGSTDAAHGFAHIALDSETINGENYFITKGLKLTLRSATMNRYFYADVDICDVTGRTVADVEIAIRTRNTAPVADDGTNVAKFGNPDRGNAYSTYVKNGTDNVPTVTYKIPYGARVIVTPYDFVADEDMNIRFGNAVHPAGGFTLNGLTGRYDATNGVLSTSATTGPIFSGVFDRSVYGSDAYIDALTGDNGMLRAIGKKSAVKKVSATTAGTLVGSQKGADSVFGDRLYFARNDSSADAYTYNPNSFDNFAYNAPPAENNNIVCNFGSTVTIGSESFGVDFIMVTAMNRTLQPLIIELTVRDRFGDSSDGAASFTVRIVIEVVNTAPTVKNENLFYELATTAITLPATEEGAEDTVVTPTSVRLSSDGNDEKTGLMTDVDKDSPEFITTRGTLIANTKNLADIYPDLSSFDEVADEYTTYDGLSLTKYMTASLLTQYTLSVTALNPTKAIESGVYVYFFVSDGNGGTALGFVQIEVLNTAPELNASTDNGFNAQNPLWAIESTGLTDIIRPRYIVGTDSVVSELKSELGAIDADIKVLTTDSDALHGDTVLSPRIDGANSTFAYVNLDGDRDTATAAQISAAVPRVASATGFATSTAPAAVVVFTSDNGEITPGAPEGYVAQILFFVGGKWLNRDQLISGLTGGTVDGVSSDAFDRELFFDTEGRWIFTDWALRLRAEDGFAMGVKLGITISLRDEVHLGGDTAGRTTAPDSDRRLPKIDVDGSFKTTVYQTISRTGIHTKDEYAKYNDYYVVEHTVGSTVTPYVSTYDGNANSTYAAGDNVSRIAYNTSGGHSVLATDGTTEIKARAVGGKDNTLAGTNSGVVYNADNIDTVAGAYKFPSVIEIPTDTVLGTAAREVYVPMSFFGQLDDFITVSDDGDVVYRPDYVGYNVGGNQHFSTSVLSEFVMALSLSDGSSVWEGASISENPYINIDAFDLSTADAPSREASVKNSISSMYYNNRLAVVTTDSNGYLSGYEKKVVDGVRVNGKSFVGDGNLMYLEEQETKLREHNFGLVFSKKNVRTATRNLSLTVKLARSNGTQNTIKDVAQDTRSVTVSIHVQNAKLDLYADESYNKDALNHDGSTYYYDITMPTSNTAEFALVRRNDMGVVESIAGHSSAHQITYTDSDYDGDYTGVKYSYRDRAYFLADSFNQLSSWSGGESAYGRVNELDNTGNAFLNTAASARAQSSIAYYYGKPNAAGAANVDDTYQPNPGIYGSNVYGTSGTEGYSSYFTASLSENGRVLNIVSGRKTLINSIAITRALGATPTQSQVIAFYKARGLVATYADANVDPLLPTRVYYPFKVLVYDSCGSGWNDASYVSVELRITITNADPTIRNVGTPVTGSGEQVIAREYGIELAVNSSVTINLYDIISDADIFVQGKSGYYTLATKKNFEDSATGISLESGDYLESPYAHDDSLGKTYNPTPMTNASGKYYYDGGGFSLMGAKDRDVIMWMETATSVTSLDKSTVPSSNNISFTVNRRTTGVINDIGEGGEPISTSVAIDEYRFKLKFYDSLGRSTIDFIFVITIKNQTPTIVAPSRSFTMQAGDELTVLTTYYDNFIGGVPNGSVAYNNSSSKTAYETRIGAGNYIGDGINKATEPGYWRYSQITSDKQNDVIYDSTKATGGHLGYYALADDDTPWRMRISRVEYNSLNNARLWVEECFSLQAEGSLPSGSSQLIAIRIDARAACENEPVTITISDGENGVITCTLYITVVSSKPVARGNDTAEDRSLIAEAGLETAQAAGTYNMFTVPAGTKTTTADMPKVEKRFDIDGFGVKTARSKYTIELPNIARDPDGDNETANMTLYRDGSFALNGVELVRDNDRVYRTEYFDIRVGNNGKSFTLTAKDFNPDAKNGYEELTFRIADSGNGDFDNTLAITFRIYTMYSDMTNPTAATATTDNYSAYLRGANKITVKSYDDYYGSVSTPRSKLAFVKLNGNDGNDGNTASYIVDPDYSASGEISYTARLYAFIDQNATSGNWDAISAVDLSEMFNRSADNSTFALNGEDYSEYFIGGITYNNAVLIPQGDAKTRLAVVNKYVDFEFAEDGTGLLFTPKAATLGIDNILLYVEVEKYVGGLRLNTRNSATLRAGALYMLDVLDSAPTAVRDGSAPEGVNFTARGAKGDSITFKIYDPANPFGALFTDSDNGDVVTIAPIADRDYAQTILASALASNPDLDWAASSGRPRAFDVAVDGEAGTLTITVNRRMDEIVNGKYASEVSFPLVFTGVDLRNSTCTTTIMLTVCNSTVGVAEQLPSHFDDATGVGYEMVRTADGNYEINAKIKTTAPLDISLNDFMTDPDYSVNADNDSYVFAGASGDNEGASIYPYAYLGDEDQTIYWYGTLSSGGINADDNRALATVSPLGADRWHRTGIRISAIDTARTLTAKTYIRIVDRAADTSRADVGVYIILTVEVMNEAPFVKEGMESSTIVMLGSDKTTPQSRLFFIGDFVDDLNETDVTGDEASRYSDTYLRIFSQQSLDITSLYSNRYTTIGDTPVSFKEVSSSSLFSVTLPTQLPEDLLREMQEAGLVPETKDTSNLYNQWFLITPIEGFFGEGAFELTISDGGAAHYDALTTTFRINVRVVYNPDDADDVLNPVTLACSKSRNVDIATLMPEIENLLEFTSGEDAGISVASNGTFSQSEYYTLTSMEFQNSADSSYATIVRASDSAMWTITAGNQITFDPIRINVKYTLNADPSKEYEKYFWLSVIKNEQPTLKFDNIVFKRYDRTDDILTDLDDSGSITLGVWQIVSDADDLQGDALRFVSASSQVPSIVSVSLSEDMRYITIKFAARGKSEIYLTVTDETGTPVELKPLIASNEDMPEGSLWLRMAASFEANKVVWVIAICSALLLLIILIIVIAVLRKRKRAREELEALLVSEMEIEEQMLRLAGGPAPTDYQSYGYLPPTPSQSAQQNPSFLIGASENDPALQQMPELAPPPADTGANPDGGENMQ